MQAHRMEKTLTCIINPSRERDATVFQQDARVIRSRKSSSGSWNQIGSTDGENDTCLFQKHLLNRADTLARSMLRYGTSGVPRGMVFDQGTVKVPTLEVSTIDA